MERRHLFVMDPLDQLTLELDTSLRIMFELERLGHACYYTEPRHLAWKKGEPCGHARCGRVQFRRGPGEVTVDSEETLSLADFTSVHMRKDPPYDMNYIASTWILDSAKGMTSIYNEPEALRSYNEKLAIFRFEEAARPALLSATPSELLAFIENEAGGDGILKPLHLFGGRGVARIQLDKLSRNQALERLGEETQGGREARLIQPFDKAIFDGEVRVFTAFGRPISWCLKKPAGDNFLANTRAGATLLPYEPTPDELRRTVKVAETLMPEGVAFTGLDLIGGYVSEINLTSPRLLVAPGDERNYYEEVAALVSQNAGRSSPSAKGPTNR